MQNQGLCVFTGDPNDPKIKEDLARLKSSNLVSTQNCGFSEQEIENARILKMQHDIGALDEKREKEIDSKMKKIDRRIWKILEARDSQTDNKEKSKLRTLLKAYLGDTPEKPVSLDKLLKFKMALSMWKMKKGTDAYLPDLLKMNQNLWPIIMNYYEGDWRCVQTLNGHRDRVSCFDQIKRNIFCFRFTW